jgi:NACHT domain
MKSAISDSHSKIEGFQKELITLKEDFDRAVDVTALKIGRDNHNKLIVAEELRFLDQLKPLNAPSFDEEHSCMEGTRTAVLNDIIAWSETSSDEVIAWNGSNDDSVFWLYGIPGVGKTYVANSLCRLLRKKGNLGGNFFCRRDDPTRGEPKRVLPNLIHRLAGIWRPYRELVAQALRDQPDFNPDSTDSEALFNRLKSLEEHPPRALVLVIDAFDECGEPRTRGRLLSTLLDVCHSVHWLKLVITSRREYDIIPFFDKLAVAGRDLATEDEAREDIWHFTKSRMALIASECHLPSDWPGKDRLEQIVERSGDLFIFVNTVCLLVDGFDPDAALALVLSGKLEDANAELHKLYSKILVSRVGRSQEKFRAFARAFIVVTTHHPLSDTTLASVTGMDLPIIRSLVDRLSSLLYQDGSKNGGIRVRHLSIIEFLTGPTCPSEFRVDLQQANAELSACCLTTMTRELKFNICDLETSLVTNAEIRDLDKRVDERIPDGLQYSCMHWSSHLCYDSDPTSTAVSALLDGFLTGQRPLFWIEVLSLMGKVPVAISALRQIKSCTKVCVCSQHSDAI